MTDRPHNPESASKTEDKSQENTLKSHSYENPAGDVVAPLVIGGEEIETGERFPVQDPGRPTETVGYAVAATLDQTQSAIDAASRAWRGWSGLKAEKRAEFLVDAVNKIAVGDGALANILTRENGKVLRESAIELQVFAERCRLAAEYALFLSHVERLAPETDQFTSATQRHPIPFRSEISRLPLGVVTVIVPFNWPLAILAASLPYALIAGNTVIVKVPPTVPLATTLKVRDLARHLPAGVLNVISGSNENVAPLIVDPRIRRLVFTGSTAAGKKMMELCSGNLAHVTLELGGNDPAIVLDDAVLDAAAIDRLTYGAFFTSGQVCMAIKRLYVHSSRYEELVEGISARLSRFRVGHGLDAATDMGPLNNARQRDVVSRMVDEARSAGHEVRELGEFADDVAASGGWYLKPTLVLNPDPRLEIVDQEQFGPSLPILPFDELDPLIDAINNHWSGLTSSVWSADPDRAAGLARSLRTGTTWINNANAVAQDDRAPFGGFRASGVGRELGRDGFLEFTEPHTVTWPPA
ncbi:MAG TPA: aldehyde dehydrogenase family protein [Rhizobium sp.]